MVVQVKQYSPIGDSFIAVDSTSRVSAKEKNLCVDIGLHMILWAHDTKALLI